MFLKDVLQPFLEWSHHGGKSKIKRPMSDTMKVYMLGAELLGGLKKRLNVVRLMLRVVTFDSHRAVSTPAQSDVPTNLREIICVTQLQNLSMTTAVSVGVLAIQGAFVEHIKLLHKAAQGVPLGRNRFWEFVEVRTSEELANCDALIIPGGESTTVSLVAARSNLLEPLRRFVK